MFSYVQFNINMTKSGGSQGEMKSNMYSDTLNKPHCKRTDSF